MPISYDENKRLANIEKHGIDFIGSQVIFDNPMITQVDGRVYYGEERLQSYAILGNRVVFMVWTDREKPHIISIRPRINKKPLNSSKPFTDNAMTKSNLPNPNLLLANAPDAVAKSDDDFNWERAIVSQNYAELKSKIGRPISDNPKQAVSIRFDSDIVEYFKSKGKGWQTAMNDALREYIATH